MCLFPITMKHPSTGEVVTFPCGKCADCVRKYQNDWSFRLSQEVKNWKYAYFLTLTYRDDAITYIPLQVPDKPVTEHFTSYEFDPDHFQDIPDFDDFGNPIYDFPFEPDITVMDSLRSRIDSIPVTRWLFNRRQIDSLYTEYLCPDQIDQGTLIPSVNIEHVQGWLKRVRALWHYNFGDNLRFKYFLCAEYGPSTLRPHYHIVIFTHEPVSVIEEYFVSDWESHFGSVHWKHSSLEYRPNTGYADVMGYVAKYCCKPAFAENPYVVYKIIDKPFRIMSKGLGLNYYSDIVTWLNNSGISPKLTGYNALRDINPDWLAEVDRLMTTVLYSKKGKPFQYRLPRYYRDRLFPTVTLFIESYDKKKKQFVYKKVTRKNCRHPLWVAYKTYVSDKYNQRLSERISSVAATFSSRPSLENYSEAAALVRQQDVATYKTHLQQLYSYYSKGYQYSY